MAKSTTWAIRVTLPDGRTALLRRGGVVGRGGGVAAYRTKAEAEAKAATLTDVQSVTVFERSHGRQWPDERKSPSVREAGGSDASLAHPEGKPKSDV